MGEKTYKYTDIVNISRNEILFRDGHLINLVECASRWAEAKGLTTRDYTCIGDRNASADTPFFTLYSKPLTKIIFAKKGLLKTTGDIKEYEKMRTQIGSYGWTLRDTSYDNI